jgi:two-component system chemotaxis response regulator CheB
VIRVLVVDDSASVRVGCQRILTADPEIQVVGTAPDPFVARDLIVARKPDVMTLDIEMPRMDGITFLRRVMHYHPMPVVILSSLTARSSEKALEIMKAGAVSVVCKPYVGYTLAEMAEDLVSAVKAASRARLTANRPVASADRPRPARLALPSTRVVAIGASTGGTVALESLLSAFPEDAPGTLIVQHMPPVFTQTFAARLAQVCAMRVREASDGDRVEQGLALVAPGGKHMVLRRGSQGYAVQVKEGPSVNHHRPSVDVLLRSVAAAAGRNAVGVLLTGMGSDGARGLLEMRKAGALTIAQDEESSVVFGMPKAAIQLEAVDKVLELGRIPAAILAALLPSRVGVEARPS